MRKTKEGDCLSRMTSQNMPKIFAFRQVWMATVRLCSVRSKPCTLWELILWCTVYGDFYRFSFCISICYKYADLSNQKFFLKANLVQIWKISEHEHANFKKLKQIKFYVICHLKIFSFCKIPIEIILFSQGIIFIISSSLFCLLWTATIHLSRK